MAHCMSGTPAIKTPHPRCRVRLALRSSNFAPRVPVALNCAQCRLALR
jgi:hypothetical protein